jgi:uncharacterized membrane protein YecN with MAPEG domain
MQQWLNATQRRSLIWSAASIGIFMIVAAALFAIVPLREVPPSATERFLNTVLQLRWPTLVLLLMVASLFRNFDTEKAADPLAGGESMRHRFNQRVLQNTIEQFVLFVPSVLGLAILAEDAFVWHAVSVAVLLFTLGRVIFWIGYHRSAQARAPGFIISFSTTLLTLAAVIWLAA